MPRYEQRDKDGNVTEVLVIDDETLKTDPEAVVKSRGPLKSQAPSAPEGYEHVASVEGDPDAMVANCMVHVYAKRGSYRKEKPSKLAGLKAVVAETKAEAKMEGVAVK